MGFFYKLFIGAWKGVYDSSIEAVETGASGLLMFGWKTLSRQRYSASMDGGRL